ncbi:MAG: glycoside hydrolase [Oscillospiraceae bacterium]|nr:glycoside hydrolase [Oscillospiraceae bacterium]
MNRLFLNSQPSDAAAVQRTCGLSSLTLGAELSLDGPFSAVYGFGERFDAFNQIGLERKIQVYEKFTEQGAHTYMPVPFCLTDAGFGVYIDTKQVIAISTRRGDKVSSLYAKLPDGADVHILHGAPEEIMDGFTRLTGRPKLPPDWAFGLWMSAHRWNTRELVERQTDMAIEHGMKPAVVVIEAWSDEATFYRFDSERFPDPAGMVRGLHEKGIKCVLWQIPVIKKLDEGQVCPEHDQDCAHAVEKGYAARNPDGTPYTIPEGRWFGGSMIPDFTNPAACDWWFGKRQYLLDMGVDGFKTDGGEFLYDGGPVFHDGSTGADMQNGYALAYTRAYARFIGEGRVLFSRAGFTGSQTAPLHWAGDQRSTWEELRHVLTAGLNAGLSGIAFWGFDIAGFAGRMPSVELYLRAFAMACFSPVMQWHSEPLGGQFAGLMASDDMVNDRSPWNIAARYSNPSVIEICRGYTDERQKLLPYLLEEAAFCAQTGRPLMAPIFFGAHTDKRAYSIEDQYMLGRRLMVAPALREGMTGREVYFPAGLWRDYWTGEEFQGGLTRTAACELPRIPVFLFMGDGHGRD